MRPAAIKASALARFNLDQMLRGRRGVNRCSQYIVFLDFFWPSIHPWQSAISTASA
jgi:hypothetical protein